MERITETKKVCTALNRDGTFTEYEFISLKDIGKGYKKLYELENIEEKYGIDLLTYFNKK